MTARSIRLRRQARSALQEIFRYSEIHHGRAQAERYRRGLKEKLEQLAALPQSAPVALSGSPIRMALYGQHRIFYRPMETGIEVGLILHKRQDFRKGLEAFTRRVR